MIHTLIQMQAPFVSIALPTFKSDHYLKTDPCTEFRRYYLETNNDTR